jgi:hypothetical protein
MQFRAFRLPVCYLKTHDLNMQNYNLFIAFYGWELGLSGLEDNTD